MHLLKDDSTPQNDDFANKDKMKAAKAWQKKKYDAGWAMLHWPKEYGGIGAVQWKELYGLTKKLSLMCQRDF